MEINRYIRKTIKKDNKKTYFNLENFSKISDNKYSENVPLVSIVCNTYNHEKFIGECIEGFLSQFVNFGVEILIHDDASKDNTAKIVKNYCQKFPQIIKPIFQKDNQYSKGVKISKTFQYSRAKGKYIAFCEGDDKWINPFKLIEEVLILEKNEDIFAVTHDVINYDFGNKKLCKHLYKPHKNGFLTFKEICDGFSYHQSSLLYRNNFDINNGVPEDLYVFPHLGDFPKSVNIFLHGKIYFIDKKMSLYRYRSNQDSFTSKKYVGTHALFLLFFENLKKYVGCNELEYVNFKINELQLLESYYSNNIKAIFANQILFSTYKKMPLKFKAKVFIKKNFKFAYKIYRKIFKAWHY